MKILMINKFLYPRGGAETYVLKLGKILESNGHIVQYFGMEDDRNIVGNDRNIYVSKQDFQTGIRKNLSAPFRIVFSAEARRKIRQILEAFQPDVVHLNNIQFHLTPSIILAADEWRRRNGKKLRIVYTAHDYQLICPNHGLFDRNMRVCEKCLGGNYMHCVATRCVKNSYFKSCLGMIDAYVWKWIKSYEYIDSIICPSMFLKKKLDMQSRFANKTCVIHNFVEQVEKRETPKEEYVLYFGKLCREKGTYTLLEVCRNMPETLFVFAGYGPAESEIIKYPNAKYVGFMTGAKLEQLIRKAKISIYPSEWHENCPFSIIESQMYGTPVIASRMGGIPELLSVGESGELFEAGNANELAQKIRNILQKPGEAERYAQNCLRQEFVTEKEYYQELMRIYGGI